MCSRDSNDIGEAALNLLPEIEKFEQLVGVLLRAHQQVLLAALRERIAVFCRSLSS